MQGAVSKRTVLPLFVLCLLYLGVNALISFYRWFPEYEWRFIVIPSIEGMCVFALSLSAGFFRKPLRVTLLFLTACVCGTLVWFGFGEGVSMQAYGMHFDIRKDLAFLPDFLIMIFHSETAGKLSVIITGAVILCSLGAGVFYALFALTASRAARLGKRVLFLMAGLCVFLPFTEPEGSLPVRLYATLLENSEHSIEQEEPEILYTEYVTENTVSYAFPFLKDRDVFLFIFESYGETLLSKEDHFSRMEPAFYETENILSEAGFSCFSRLIESPITGGKSWLADATLLTGIRVDSQGLFDALLNTGFYNMTHIFSDADYRTIMSAPGTSKAGNAWKSFYRFTEYYFHDDFGYKGPYFCFGSMPDQYQLNWLRKGPLAENTGPLFLMSILVSSHTPFNYVPQYIDDWDTLGDGSEFRETKNLIFENRWLSGKEYPEGYTASVAYVLRVLRDFMRNEIDVSSLVIIVGDHQPRFPIRERGASSSVIMHIFSQDRDLVFPFSFYGFNEGIIPERTNDPMKMESFLPCLIEIISGKWIERKHVTGM